MAVILLLALWAMAFALSFILFAITEPSGDGFTRGINRVSLFLGWQAIAGLLAVAAFGVSRPLNGAAGMRRAASVPLAVSGAVGIAFVAVVGWGIWGVR